MNDSAIFCKACGKAVEPDDRFCRACGAALPQASLDSAAVAASSTSSGTPIASVSSTTAMLRPLVTPPAQPNAVAADDLKDEPRATESPETGTADAANPAPPGDSSAVAPPSFAGYAAGDAAGTVADESSAAIQPRKKRPPVLELVVLVLLLGGAGASVWMLHSSLPAGKAAPANPSVELTIAPASAKVKAGKALDLAATVSGSDDVDVSWSVQEGDEGGRVVPRGAKSSGDTLSAAAVYVAPQTPGTYHVVATSKADPGVSTTAEITVQPRR